ncbi:MAG: hypothetical protein ABSG38_12985 [Spirochaetia bacterium]|jgi:hypothetical protein
MAEMHVFSLKIGSSHGLWQYKLSGTHDRVMMHSLRRILDTTCQLLDYSCADRSAVYLFYFSAEPFEGCQVCLEKMRAAASGGCHYRVKQSNIGAFMANGVFPAIVNSNYLRGWPERIYFRLEKSLTGGIIN